MCRETSGLVAAEPLPRSYFLSRPPAGRGAVSGNSPEAIPSRFLEHDPKQETPQMRLILDKIRVPPERPRLSRTRLLSLLYNSLDTCTSTIINGSAGTGKTTLAADFARRCRRRVAWYTVGAADGASELFFRYLIESVRRQRPGFGERIILPLLESATTEDMPMLAESFIFELSEGDGEPLLIVVDDLHLVYDSEWVVPFFRRLLPLLPAEAHVLITGRGLPPAPLWRMRSKQTLCVIEEPTLCFTESEAMRLFASYGLSEAQARATLGHARGRASLVDKFGTVLSIVGRVVTGSFVAGERRLHQVRVQHIHGYQY
jgi:LuxR family maltose regulon positive regulatory protein